jgi:hypothetical protein
MKKQLTRALLCCYLCLVFSISKAQNFIDNTTDVVITPVQLINFKAALQGNTVQVTWSTATETNNSHFNVLRSLNGKDFNSIGRVQGKGTTSIVSTYSFTDGSIAKQNLYYQLEQVDADGKKTFSAIVLVRVDANGQAQVSFFPNPIKDKKLSIIMNNAEAGNYTMSLLNAVGAVVYSQVYKVASNNSSIGVQLPQQLPAGLYILQVSNASASMKVVKQVVVN